MNDHHQMHPKTFHYDSSSRPPTPIARTVQGAARAGLSRRRLQPREHLELRKPLGSLRSYEWSRKVRWVLDQTMGLLWHHFEI